MNDSAAGTTWTVVEGAGGALTPVFGKLSVADVARRLRIPALIVSRAGLGTINHTVMTYECLRGRGVECLGFFLNRFPSSPDLAERTNADCIAAITGSLLPGGHPGPGGPARFRVCGGFSAVAGRGGPAEGSPENGA